MTQKEKLIKKLYTKPKDFTWDELCTLLGHLGFKEISHSKTGGSRRKFHNKRMDLTLIFHKPHPKAILKSYVINQLIET